MFFQLPEFTLGMFLDELPDELNLVNDPGGTQNGAKDGLVQQEGSSITKHQQLSQLLSSNSTAPSNVQNNTATPLMPQQQSVASLAASLATLSSKTPLTNSLSSPGGLNKDVPTAIPHSMNNDIIASTPFSSGGTSANNISMGPGGVVTMANAMNIRPASSQRMMNAGNAHMNMNQTQMINGPHGVLGARGVTTTMPSFQGSSPQANSTAVGNQIGNTITSSIGNNQVNATRQQIAAPGINANQTAIRVRFFYVICSFIIVKCDIAKFCEQILS